MLLHNVLAARVPDRSPTSVSRDLKKNTFCLREVTKFMLGELNRKAVCAYYAIEFIKVCYSRSLIAQRRSVSTKILHVQ